MWAILSVRKKHINRSSRPAFVAHAAGSSVSMVDAMLINQPDKLFSVLLGPTLLRLLTL